jgi:hypothetical protein
MYAVDWGTFRLSRRSPSVTPLPGTRQELNVQRVSASCFKVLDVGATPGRIETLHNAVLAASHLLAHPVRKFPNN